MAYNPFNIFRRNQKAIFAVVTVFIMFTFVLSSGMSGGADFFDWLPQWVRGKTKKGDFLCTIDGDKVYSQQLEQLRRRRVIASKFMLGATNQSVVSMREALLNLSAQGSPEFAFFFQAALQSRNPQEFMQLASIVSRQIKDNPKAKTADKEAATLLEGMAGLMRSGGQITNIPTRTDRDLIEFMLWERKAAALGIDYTLDDVKVLISKEFMGQFKSDVEVLREMRQMPGFSVDACMKALGAEFAVRTAQTAVFGPVSDRGDRTLTAAPIWTPPYELFEFYREKTSPTAYELLRVPVDVFMSQVTATPTDDELLRLYRDRESYEPDPARQEPGFRDPRKVKIEWVSVTGEEPYYRKAAADWATRAEQIGKSEVWGLMVPMPGMGIGASALLTVAPGAIKEPLVYKEYERKVANHRLQLDTNWDRPTFSGLFGPLYGALDTSVVKPQNLAALAGGMAGSTAGLGGPFLPANLFLGATVAAEQRGRIKAGMPLFLGAIPGPGMLPTLIGGEAAFRKNLPEPLPIEAFKPELLKELTENKARELAVADLRKLKEEVEKLTETGKAREAAARDKIAEFVKVRGIKFDRSTDFHGEFTIGDDPGLAPLKAQKEKGLDGVDPHTGRGAAPVQFGQSFFWSTNPATRSREATSGTYKPEFYPERAADTAISPFGSKTEPVFLAWRIDDKQARSMLFEEAKPRVIEAWKRAKARELAKAEAERLAAELRAKPGESEFTIVPNMTQMQLDLRNKTTDAKAKERVKLFRLENVAPFAIGFDKDPRSGAPTQIVTSFQLRPTNDIPYPTPEMDKAILEERTKPPKTVMVHADQPRDSYYVIALLDRRERSPEEFRAHVYASFGGSQVGQRIMGEHARQSVGKAHESIVGLLKKEFKYVETEEQKKKLDDREKKGGSDE